MVSSSDRDGIVYYNQEGHNKMTAKEPNIFEVIQRWSILVKKIIKYLRQNHIPNDYESMKVMKQKLENEETRRMEMNRMRESIKHILKKKKQRAYWNKLERRRKIRKFFHLPYRTLNEDDFMKDLDA